MMISQIPTTLTSIGVFTLFGSTTVPPNPSPLLQQLPKLVATPMGSTVLHPSQFICPQLIWKIEWKIFPIL
ncbi:MAG: hypothetical protein LVT47_00960 [Cyanobacteria bacterium LVE1205-1]